ncbi:MAG: hypothetical protein H0T83_05745, partial [Chthoniobacterales bacterium]|nr:hypothetical protein [Chthoniobacterales bacterium]
MKNNHHSPVSYSWRPAGLTSSAQKRNRRGFFRTTLFAFVAAALVAAPTFSNAQNPQKPTARVMHRLRTANAEGADKTTTAPVRSTHLPKSAPAIPQRSTTTASDAAAWTAIGPTPIPNGQTLPAGPDGISLTQAPVSGRVTAVAIDPADANTAYVGTAQGGVYQTRDGGRTWRALMDSAMTLAVGSLELDPTDATSNTLLIGSGESNFSGDSYAGFGVYKVTGLKTSPVLSGPFNQSTTGTDVLSERGIPGMAIDPNNHNNVYVGTATAQQGIGPQAFA